MSTASVSNNTTTICETAREILLSQTDNRVAATLLSELSGSKVSPRCVSYARRYLRTNDQSCLAQFNNIANITSNVKQNNPEIISDKIASAEMNRGQRLAQENARRNMRQRIKLFELMAKHMHYFPVFSKEYHKPLVEYRAKLRVNKVIATDCDGNSSEAWTLTDEQLREFDKEYAKLYETAFARYVIDALAALCNIRICVNKLNEALTEAHNAGVWIQPIKPDVVNLYYQWREHANSYVRNVLCEFPELTTQAEYAKGNVGTARIAGLIINEYTVPTIIGTARKFDNNSEYGSNSGKKKFTKVTHSKKEMRTINQNTFVPK